MLNPKRYLVQRHKEDEAKETLKLAIKNENTQLKSSLKLKEKQIADLKISLNINKQELTAIRKQMYKLSTDIKEKTATIKNLKEVTKSQKQEIEELRLNKIENGIRLKNTRQACIQHFNSRVDRRFSDNYSDLITKAQKIYNSNGHLDKIQYCPAILYMNSVQVPESSESFMNESNNEPPAKRMKARENMRDSNINIKSLKALVLNLESRHSENYHLWRNVLWALNKCGLENGYDTLEIADLFSKRSLKYKNIEDVKKTFQSSDGTMSLQYLTDVSKVYEEGLYNMGEYLSTIVPLTYLPLTLTQVDFRDHKKIGLKVKCADESYVLYIIPDLFVLTDQKGKRLGVLKKKIKSKSSILQSLCPSMRDGFTATFGDDYEFKSASLILNNPLDAENASITFPNGQRGSKNIDLQRIHKALRKETMQFLRKSGKIFADESNDFIDHQHHISRKTSTAVHRPISSLSDNSLSDIIDTGNESSSSIRDDVQLVQALFAAKPSIKTRYRFDSGKTLYYCQPQTNLWEIIGEKEFDDHLQNSFTYTTELKLTQAELTHIKKKSSIANLRNHILSEIEVTDFAKSLNSKLHLFITDNRTIDTSSTPPIIRHIEIEDLAKTTCGWSYDYDLAATQKEAVQAYFNTMFPNQSERDWVLTFIAKLLNGKRINEPFLVLLDEQGGKTGKTTLIKLLRAVFGNYFIANCDIINTKVYCGDYIERLKYLDEKRLLLADGLQKTDYFHDDIIRKITGDRRYERNPIEVRAGLVVVVNEDNMPGFQKVHQGYDKKFHDAMVVCPLRSRFVTEKEFQEITKSKSYMKYVRVAEDSLELQFSEWKSAVLDLLLEYCNKSFAIIPKYMMLCKCRIFENYFRCLDMYLLKSKTANSFVSASQIQENILKSETHLTDMHYLKHDMEMWASIYKCKYRARYAYTDETGKYTEPVIMNVTIDSDEE